MYIYDGGDTLANELNSLTGSYEPYSYRVTSTGNEVYIKFVSDDYTDCTLNTDCNAAGFKIQYERG